MKVTALPKHVGEDQQHVIKPIYKCAFVGYHVIMKYTVFTEPFQQQSAYSTVVTVSWACKGLKHHELRPVGRITRNAEKYSIRGKLPLNRVPDKRAVTVLTTL